VAELKNRLSHYLDRVKRGETILVLERSTPVARIVPASPPAELNTQELEAWLRRLEAKGVLRVGARKGVGRLLTAVPSGRRPTRAVSTLIHDREQR
jgi:prevent-host-death family protein